MARWADDNTSSLALSQPAMPEHLDDRARDNWEPLLAIADLMGGSWPREARAASVLLAGAVDAEDKSEGILLLGDIREIFDARDEDKIRSKDLVDQLVSLESRPWGERGRLEKPLTPISLGQKLRPFGIRPGTMRVSPIETAKGYERKQFEETWETYLPLTSASPVTLAQMNAHAIQASESVSNTPEYVTGQVEANDESGSLCDGVPGAQTADGGGVA